MENLSTDSFNTLSASYSVLALDAYAKAVGKPKGMDVSVSEMTGKDRVVSLPMQEGLFPSLSFSPGAKSIRIENREKNHLFYQVLQKGFDKKLPDSRVEEGVEVEREYLTLSGDSAEEAVTGEVLEVRIRIRAKDHMRYNVAVVDLLPGGFEPVTESVRKKRPGEEKWKVRYADVREDRVILYCDVDTKMREFVYRIRATSAGKFRIPPLYAESMYDRSVRAVSPSPGMMAVKREER